MPLTNASRPMQRPAHRQVGRWGRSATENLQLLEPGAHSSSPPSAIMLDPEAVFSAATVFIIFSSSSSFLGTKKGDVALFNCIIAD